MAIFAGRGSADPHRSVFGLHLDMPARCLTDNCQNICSHFLLRSSLSEDMSVTERIDRERAGTAHGQQQYL
mgnify:CR=1 FL=1